MKLSLNSPDVKKIKKPMVFMVAVVLLVTYGCLTFFPKGQKGKKKTEEMNLTPTEGMLNNDTVVKLPSSYADIKAPKETATKETEHETDMLDIKGSGIAVEQTGIMNYRRPEPHDAYTATVRRETGSSYGSRGRAVTASYSVQYERRSQDELESSPIGYGSARRSNSDGGAPIAYNPAEGAERLLAGLVESQNEERGKGRTSQERFLDNAGKHKETVLNEDIERPQSPYTLFAGSIIPGAMVTGINSDLPGEIIAIVRENVYDSVKGRHLLVPQGTKIFGSYDSGVEYGQNRVLFAWDRLIFPNGDSIQLRGMKGTDRGGYSGAEADVDNHVARLAGAILMSSFLAVGTEKLDNGNTFRTTMAEDVNRSGQRIVDRQLNVKPTLKVRPGERFNVMVNKDIILKPYRG